MDRQTRPGRAIPSQSLGDLVTAHEQYGRVESREYIYPIALDRVNRALTLNEGLRVSEGIALLLDSWNRRFYSATGTAFDKQHINSIDRLFERWRGTLVAYRGRRIESLAYEDGPQIQVIFNAFEALLGKVGA